MKIEDSLSPTDAAAAAGIKRTTLDSAIDRGDVPHAKDQSGRVHVLLKDVQRWLADPNRSKRGRPANKKRSKP